MFGESFRCFNFFSVLTCLNWKGDGVGGINAAKIYFFLWERGGREYWLFFFLFLFSEGELKEICNCFDNAMYYNIRKNNKRGETRGLRCKTQRGGALTRNPTALRHARLDFVLISWEYLRGTRVFVTARCCKRAYSNGMHGEKGGKGRTSPRSNKLERCRKIWKKKRKESCEINFGGNKKKEKKVGNYDLKWNVSKSTGEQWENNNKWPRRGEKQVASKKLLLLRVNWY